MNHEVGKDWYACRGVPILSYFWWHINISWKEIELINHSAVSVWKELNKSICKWLKISNHNFIKTSFMRFWSDQNGIQDGRNCGYNPNFTCVIGNLTT